MTLFWFLLTLLGAVASFFVIWPWLGFRQRKPTHDQNTNEITQVKGQAYQEQLDNLQQELSQGLVSKEEYERYHLTLQRDLLSGQSVPIENQPTHASISSLWVILLTALLILLGSYFTYLSLGASVELTQQNNMQITAAMLNADDSNKDMVTKLSNQLQQEPNNPEAWYLLGHALLNENKTDLSIQAFEQGLNYVDTTQPLRVVLLGQYAQALLSIDNGFSQRVNRLLDEAVSINPSEVSILSLLGLREFSSSNYLQAIELWQQASQKTLDSKRSAALQSSIAQARQAMQVNATEPRLNLNIRFAQGLEFANNEQAMAYIYVLVPNQALPLWGARLKASELPTRFVMSEAYALASDINIKDYDSVSINVHVSHAGTVGIQPGDLLGSVQEVAIPTQQLIDVVIDQIVQE